MSPGDINSTDLPCLASVWPGNISYSRNSSYLLVMAGRTHIVIIVQTQGKCNNQQNRGHLKPWSTVVMRVNYRELISL